MANLSTYLSDKLLDHAMGSTSYTMPSTYLALFTTNPTMPAGTGGTEVSGGSYARVPISSDWSAASAESKSNNVTITFTTATANWGTVVGVGIYDALTVGNLLAAGPLGSSQVVNSGGTFSITSGNLTVTFT